MSGEVSVERVRFDHHPSGLGLSTATPRVSWRIITANGIRSWRQHAYEIELQRHGSPQPFRYKIDKDTSVLAPWPAVPLASREQARLRVRVWGNHAQDQTVSVSTWSEWATVEASLLYQEDWAASWITAPELTPENGPLPPLLFRKTDRLPQDAGKVTRARLYITAQGVYDAYLNGIRVGDDYMAPGWTSYRHRLNYQVFDVTPVVRDSSELVLGIEAAEGWFAGRLGFLGGRRFNYGKEIAVLAQLEVHFEDGERYTMVSDSTWKARPSPTFRSEIYDGEGFDSRINVDRWNDVGDLSSQNWRQVVVQDNPISTKLVTSHGPPMRVTQEIAAVGLIITPSGKVILDFGQNLVGKLRVRGLSGNDGHAISFAHAEVLEHGELGTRPLRGAAAIDTFICSSKRIKEWTPKFTFHGFRYVQVDGWSTQTGQQPLALDSFSALVVHTDMKRVGYFECSDPLLNQLHENAVWSMRGNFLSIPTDCPQRDERLGWTGDIQIFAPSATFLFESAGMLAEWMQDVAAEQREHDGVPPVTVPNVIEDLWPTKPQAVWGDVVILVPWTVYLSSGDIYMLTDQFASMLAWLEKGVLRGPDGLWDPDHWQLGDWLDPRAPPHDPGAAITDSTLVADAYLNHITRAMAKVSAALNRSADASKFGMQAFRLNQAFRDKYVSPAGLVVGDTQTALALAISFRLLGDESQIRSAASRLVRLVRQAKFRVSSGFAGTPVVLHALSMTGHAQIAYRMIHEDKCPSWIYPVTMGATTIWERWDSLLPDGSINPGEMTSFNHYALGSVINWLHEVAGGIQPLAPGWKRFQVFPTPGGKLRSAAVKHESPYGLIECQWFLEAGSQGDTFRMKVSVPPNAEALVKLPGEDPNRYGVRVGSGVHDFSCKFVADAWPPTPLTPYVPGLGTD